MKKYITLGAVAMSLLTTGCSNDLISENSPVDNSGKERIVLGAGDDQAAFQTRAGFTNTTRIVARYVSDSRDGSTAKVVKTVLNASAEEAGKGYSDVKYLDGKTRYWDDAYGRKSILSVYAVAIPNKNDGTETSKLAESVLKGAGTWAEVNASDNNEISWAVAATQTTTTLEDEDLTYSNNIQQTGKKGVYTWNYAAKDYPTPTYSAETGMNSSEHKYGDPEVSDGRMYFTQEGKKVNEALTDAPGHFDKGQMEFKHALSRIRVNLVKGAGYDGTLTLTGNLQLNNMPAKGALDIKEGTWTLATTGGTATVNMAQIAKTEGKDLTYEAQVLPGYVFANDDNNAMQFTISNNTYYITNKMLRAALEGKDGVTSDYDMLQGNRYIFDITVAKAKIQNITATIVDWNEITADNFGIDNSHLTFKFYDNNNACDDVKLYKFEQGLENIVTTDATYAAAPVAGSAYTAVAGFTKVDGEDYYTTSEYYKDNKTAYHFRSLNTISEGKLNSDKNAFTMTSGNDDYHWGAPMNYGLTAIPYNSETGYSTSIAKGIIAADNESKINLTEIHMMSQLVIKLTTPETGGVDLTDAEVYLTKYCATGTVDMSLGKITPTTTITDKSSKFSADGSTANTYVFNVVPQELKRGTNDADYIGITIKTKDNNEYYIIKRLSEITATAVGSQVTNLQTKDNAITTWYPGHRYTYTFNIKKKEIEVITATIVPWNDVTGANTDLDLEK